MDPADWTALQARIRTDQATDADWDAFLAELERGLAQLGTNGPRRPPPTPLARAQP
jgi:hypothetical protein